MTFLIILLVIVIIISMAIASSVSNSRKRTQIPTHISRIKNFSAMQQVIGVDGATGIAIDEASKAVCLARKDGREVLSRVVGYRDILSAEILEDGESVTKTSRSSQLGGALLGGVLFGSLGAAVGGLSGKRTSSNKIKRIDLQVVVNDIKDPTHSVCFLDVECKTSSSNYKTASKEVKKWSALVEVLIRQADSADRASQTAQPSLAPTSVSDEIRKLGELRDSGLLSDDEFQRQKTKVLA